ncbi:diguanylate cyclase [bacterium]|nr:diguanylate cyclase [bacterium]
MMRSLSYPIFVLSIIAAALMLISCGSSDDFSAVDGVMDLRDFNFDDPISLDGEWRFIWNDSISDEESNQENYIEIEVPDSWNGYDYNGQKLPGHGSGSYYLTILLPESNFSYALGFPTAGTAYNLFVNEKVIGGIGLSSNDPALARPAYQPRNYELGFHSSQIRLRVDVSNHHHRLGGLWESISFGTSDDIAGSRENRIAMELFLVGAILIMGIYHLGVFSLSTHGKAALYFGIFCLIIAMRTLTTGEIFLHQLWPSLPWHFQVKFEYLTFYLGIPIFFLFIRLQFPDEINKWVAQTVLAISSIFVLIVLFTGVEVFSLSLLFFQPFSLLAMLYVIYGLGLAFLRGEEGSALVLMGFLAIAVTFLNDILYVSNVIQTGHFISLGLLIFILAQAFLISVRFSKAYDTIDTQRIKLERTNVAYHSEIEVRKSAEREVLNHKDHLEELVKERTTELEIANDRLKELSRVDGLTGIANRRRLDEEMDREWKRMLRDKRPLSVVMSDIDHFKLYNDTYGHQQGDDCLVRVATAIQDSVNRPGDLAARYGGEEFCIILPETDVKGAIQIAELIRKCVRDLNIKHESSPVAPMVTLSLGVATLVPDLAGQPGLLLQAADRALYQAKGNGRDRVERNMDESPSSE